MTSALTTAVQAAPGLVSPAASLAALFPMEDAAGATTTADAVNGTTLAITGAGPAPGGAEIVAGAGGSWSFSGVAGSYLSRAVGSGTDPLKLTAASSVGVWTQINAVPAATTVLVAYTGSWSLSFLNYPYLGSAYSNTTAYLKGQNCTSGGYSWLALQNSTGVTPGTNAAVWVALVTLSHTVYLSASGLKTLVSQTFIPVGLPVYIEAGFSGSEQAIHVNGVTYAQSFPTLTGTDTLATPTGTFEIGGSSGPGATANIWSVSVNATGALKGRGRYIYTAGITQADMPPALPAFLDLTLDAKIPAVTNQPGAFYCSICGCMSRINEGFRMPVPSGGEKYHKDCAEAHGTNATPAALSAASTINQFADRASRAQQWMIDTQVHKFDNFKPTYMDTATSLVEFGGGTLANAVDRFQLAFGAAVSVLARYSGSQKNGRLVAIASAIMEQAISTQLGAPASWLAPGYTAQNAQLDIPSFVSSSNWIGSYTAPSEAAGGGGPNWSAMYAAEIVLMLRRYVDPEKTLPRWINSVVAAGENAWNGSTVLNQAPNFPYWSNGNYIVRIAANMFYLWLLTGDQLWAARYQTAMAFMIAPYGVQVNWEGGWNPLTSYHAATDANAAKGLTPAGAIAPVADAVRILPTNYPTTYFGSQSSAYICIQSISGNAANISPAADVAAGNGTAGSAGVVGTYWRRLDTQSYTINGVSNYENAQNWDGQGVQLAVAGTQADGSDSAGYITEWAGNSGAAQGGGAAGTAMYLQPGFSGDYNTVQLGDLGILYGIQLAAGQVDSRVKFLINSLMNQGSRYPFGGPTSATGTNPLNNPQATFFNTAITVSSPATGTIFSAATNTAQYAWATDRLNQASGGYSTRHSLVDGFRCGIVGAFILAGYRPDLPAGLAFGQFSSIIEGITRGYATMENGSPTVMSAIGDNFSPYLLLSSKFPKGF